MHDIHHQQMTVRILLLLVCLLLLGGLLYYFISTGLIQVPFLSNNPPIAPVAQSPTASTSLGSPTTPAKPAPVSVLPTLPSKPPVTPTPPSTPTSGIRTITNADGNGTVDLTNGQEFAIDLGGGLHWTVQFNPASAISQVSASTTGAPQGIFKAIAPGTVEVNGSGAPICAPHQACPDFVAVFKTTLDVH